MSFADELNNTKTYDELEWEWYIKSFYSYIKDECKDCARSGYNSIRINSRDFFEHADYYELSEDNPYVQPEFEDENFAQKVLDELKKFLREDGLKIINTEILRGSSYGHEERIAKNRSESDARAIKAMNFLLGGNTDPHTYYQKKWVKDGYRYYFKLEIGW